ncbi:hypothetical protein U4I41_10130 [Stenotrophomonas maltophilia]|uniref:hypothetical protein n=1 Tax=Stenotrophomonas maltophilia TaxID=40324 RepID=UPI002ACC4987|nr:hypothetical protein [Stenotrophomonas maltophilia]MDZ5832707.1 hypothetical protein [Stenotrophomonas maltophilia]
MDREIWRMGRKVAREKGRRYKNWELDFVRGLHQGRALSSLAADLTISTGIPVRLMSIWLDKNAWVTWKDSAGHLVSRRELADLAVVVRQPMGGKVAQWMWLLQAKRTMHLLDSYVGSSSLHELDLLHRMPDFSLLEGDGKTRRLIASNIALANEFAIGKTPAGVSPWPCPGVVPWTFLDFDSDVKDASSAARNHFSPVSARWLGTPSAPAGSWAEQWLRAGGGASPLLASYTACLLGIISGQQVAWRHPGHASACRTFAPGAPLDPSVYPQWHRLYTALMTRSVGGVSGHAKSSGNPSGSVLQFSQLMAQEASSVRWLASGFGFPDYRPVGWLSGAQSSFSGQWAIAGLPEQEARESLRMFDGLETSSWPEEMLASEQNNDGGEPPEMSESDSDDGYNGGMQVLFVDLLRPPR